MEYFDSSKYNAIVEKMEKCVSYYEKIEFYNNKFSLYLANGEILNIRFFRENIAHLLGLRIDVLKKYNLVRSTMNSYECLKYFIENNYSILQKLKKANIPYETLFSSYINEKLDSFNDNINIKTDDLEFIIKYDSEKTFKIEEHSEISDYYIIRKIKGEYHVLGLIKDSVNNKYYKPVTSRKYENFDEFNEYITRIAIKQDLTYCYLIKISNLIHDYENSFNLKIEDKMSLLKKVMRFSKQFNCTCSVANDYLFSINKTKTDKTNISLNVEILKMLSECIKSGNVLDSNVLNEVCGDVEVGEELIDLINVCNDLVCSSESVNELAQSNYSELNQENITLKQELAELRKQLKESENKNEQLVSENNTLSEQNNQYEQDMNVLNETFQKVFGKR